MMKPFIAPLAIVALLAGSASVLMALDIPLHGGGGQSGSANIGFVDMERIFQLYPKTQAAKQDYAKQLRAKRQDLARREAELQSVKNKLTVLESTLNNPGTSPAPATEPGSEPLDDGDVDPRFENLEAKEPATLLELRKELEEKKADFEDQKKRAQDDLLVFERRQSQIILGNIYQSLKELADEEQLTLVVDKSSILYGSATVDLTEKLQNKLRGF